MIKNIFKIGLLAVVLSAVGTTCFAQTSTGGDAMLTLTSVFQEGQSIPKQFSCQGQNISPSLSWQGAPPETRSFVLIMDDPDAPNGTWTHWVLFNIPAGVSSLSENIQNLPAGTLQGLNSWGKTGYGGPCPPRGQHRYIFKLFALDTVLNLQSGADQNSIETAMKNHVIGQATLMGKYQKL